MKRVYIITVQNAIYTTKVVVLPIAAIYFACLFVYHLLAFTQWMHPSISYFLRPHITSECKVNIINPSNAKQVHPNLRIQNLNIYTRIGKQFLLNPTRVWWSTTYPSQVFII